MRPFTDPPIDLKIAKMKERVRWQHPWLQNQGIDQTRLVLVEESLDRPAAVDQAVAEHTAIDLAEGENAGDDRTASSSDPPSQEAFSFLVIGDTGWGPQETAHPQRHIAQQMVPHLQDCRFTLHTGDVVYTTGSQDFYPQNFIHPYREWLVGGEQPGTIAYDRMIFRHPFFPTLGNHDYCHMPLAVGVAVQGLYSLFRVLGLPVRQNIGWRGSQQGDTYARAFIDYLQAWTTPEQLQQHLQQHYCSTTDTGRCLTYRPGQFTRVPNRYYSFVVGGVEFFALDSTTLNQWDPAAEDGLCDPEQRQWLRDRLIRSWQNPQIRGRILFFHHPPYVTEATKWKRAETYAMRQSLRWVLDQVVAAIPDRGDRPIVDLILAGHAHCLEHLETGDTGHGDAHLHWWVCGGSGCSTRRQRREGPTLPEWPAITADWVPSLDQTCDRDVAYSRLYIGKEGRGETQQERYSFLRIDVAPGLAPNAAPGLAHSTTHNIPSDTAATHTTHPVDPQTNHAAISGTPLQLTIRPFVSYYDQGQWWDEELPSIQLGGQPLGSGDDRPSPHPEQQNLDRQNQCLSGKAG